MTRQWYWPNWWKLWPSYRKYEDYSYSRLVLFEHVFCLGAFQCRWRSRVIL
jgi:hypothetical protein